MDSAADGSRPVPFPQTQWSVILEARDTAIRQETLERLARLYWKPVYWFIRLNRGRSREDAQDLTQEFFLQLLQDETLAHFEGASRFRSFLAGAVRRFVRSMDRAARARRRGGDVPLIPIEELQGVEPAATVSKETDPERAFDRAWAKLVLTRAIDDLIASLTAPRDGRKREVARLFYKDALDGRPPLTRAQVAERLGAKEKDVENDLRAIRVLLRRVVERHVRETVASKEDVDAEIEFILTGR